MAWLQGLSPKQNRDVPPLDYELVYLLKQSFPELEIVINGGINSMDQCQQHLQQVDGVMMGREAYSNPYCLAEVDSKFYASHAPIKTREYIMQDYIAYTQSQLQAGVRLNSLSKHIVGLYHGEPRSRLWRRHISENAHLPSSGVEVLQDAYRAMLLS
jgi:tRNA-dihydrouridine synthase A